MITIEPSAHDYFTQLIQQQDMDRPGLRLWVENGGTPAADCQLAYCEQGDEESDDLVLDLEGFKFYVDGRDLELLDEAVVSFEDQGLGGSLSIKAPKLKGHAPSSSASLMERVAWVLESEINPMVASHGGRVALEDVTDEGVVLLRFGGGCHGCGMVDVTLKQGIEGTLKERLPEITAVQDATDHSTGTNPYY